MVLNLGPIFRMVLGIFPMYLIQFWIKNFIQDMVLNKFQASMLGRKIMCIMFTNMMGQQVSRGSPVILPSKITDENGKENLFYEKARFQFISEANNHRRIA